MESLLVNTIISFWLVAFGAMALFPLLIDLRADSTPHETPVEDQIISIQLVAMRHKISAPEPVATVDAQDAPESTRPLRQHAA